jgi:hypothetical protein
MATRSLIDEIGERSLSGQSMHAVSLDYKCCVCEITEGRLRNCVTEKTQLTQSFRNFERFRVHMWKDHKVDIIIRCAEIVAAKQNRAETANQNRIAERRTQDEMDVRRTQDEMDVRRTQAEIDENRIEEEMRIAATFAARLELSNAMSGMSIAPKTAKKVTSFVPKKAAKKVPQAIVYEYQWDDGTP